MSLQLTRDFQSIFEIPAQEVRTISPLEPPTFRLNIAPPTALVLRRNTTYPQLQVEEPLPLPKEYCAAVQRHFAGWKPYHFSCARGARLVFSTSAVRRSGN